MADLMTQAETDLEEMRGELTPAMYAAGRALLGASRAAVETGVNLLALRSEWDKLDGYPERYGFAAENFGGLLTLAEALWGVTVAARDLFGGIQEAL